MVKLWVVLGGTFVTVKGFGTTFQDALGRLKKSFDCLALAVSNDGSYTTNPRSEYILTKGDRLLVLSKKEPVVT